MLAPPQDSNPAKPQSRKMAENSRKGLDFIFGTSASPEGEVGTKQSQRGIPERRHSECNCQTKSYLS